MSYLKSYCLRCREYGHTFAECPSVREFSGEGPVARDDARQPGVYSPLPSLVPQLEQVFEVALANADVLVMTRETFEALDESVRVVDGGRPAVLGGFEVVLVENDHQAVATVMEMRRRGKKALAVGAAAVFGTPDDTTEVE